ncbi:MAG TPA: hypothetical protein VMZ53_24365 [Kofleriaceae bacterium]|nr:hypothetical protein [Kofleriaceae bacterium]
MSYRNDHDAALARINALELEDARLRAENAELRAALRHAPIVAEPYRVSLPTIAAVATLGVFSAVAGLVVALAL